MISKKSLASFLFFLLVGQAALSRDSRRSVYSLNLYDGLPSKYVYSALSDSLGYLWFCSPQGVVRYNGYDFQLYNVSDGLANDDVWGFYIDRQQRLWFRSISNKISYIQNNRLVTLGNTTGKVLYPKHITNYEEGIMFFTDVERDAPNNSLVLCYEKNDKIYFAPFRFPEGDVTDNNLLYAQNGDTIKTWRFHISQGVSLMSECRDTIAERRGFDDHVSLGKFLLSYKKGSNYYRVFDLEQCKYSYRLLPDDNNYPERIVFSDRNRGSCFILTERSIFKLDTAINVVAKYPLSELLPAYPPITPTNFYEDTFWGKCITTKNAGVFLHYSSENSYRKLGLPVSDIDMVFTHSPNEICFFSNSQRKLLTLDTNGSPQPITAIEADLQKLVSLPSGEMLAIAFDKLYLLDHKSGRLKRLDLTGYSFGPIKDVVVDCDGQYVLATSTKGLYKVSPADSPTRVRRISRKRFEHLIYDSLRNMVWAYNNNTLEVYANGSSFLFNETAFSSLGIKNIEQVIIDNKYGNILIKDYDNLYWFNMYSGTIGSVFSDYYLKDTKCVLEGDRLVLAGTYGVIVSKLTGVCRKTPPIVYRNLRKSLYQYVDGVAVTGSQVVINTDKGVYRLPLNTDTFLTTSQPFYKIIVGINDKLYDLAKLGKIEVSQEMGPISFDAINPKGEGQFSFKYKIPGVVNDWQQLNGHELHLPRIPPGKEYELYLIAQDDFRISHTFKKTLYVIPYWWQMSRWIVFFWTIGFIAFAILVLLIVIVTRYVVIKNNEKRRFMTELELRSVYSLLNPHFVFNTLNLALFYIKKKQQDDAYESVLKFSNLLRGYLNSSRNRYIPLSEEVGNLKNYIELQQARFNDVFTYSLTMEHIDTPEKILIPSLLLQPIVENAINHGLLPKQKEGRLSIHLKRDMETNSLSFVVDDNGIGRRKSMELHKTAGRRKSLGNDLIDALIALLNQYDRIGIEITYIDKEMPLEGTTAIITIKHPLHERHNKEHYC